MDQSQVVIPDRVLKAGNDVICKGYKRLRGGQGSHPQISCPDYLVKSLVKFTYRSGPVIHLGTWWNPH